MTVVCFRCPECRGRRVIANPKVSEFCQKHSVTLWQTGQAVLMNASMCAEVGGLPAAVWPAAGFSEDAFLDFAEIAHAPGVIACPACGNGGDVDGALSRAEAAIQRVISEGGEQLN
ncbi:hypothetical protein JL101_036480 (plasmid) [Skermanella rosea]|uniref:hypothetical protein n=1 Tax=Skermanella rosea TaxID=1817965 RepID=UPI0019320F54|nr:hypothetical protein [Skermanella rosea]UEM08241.1 hypothetical protein JL101_036480 [Skermanella rosea]